MTARFRANHVLSLLLLLIAALSVPSLAAAQFLPGLTPGRIPRVVPSPPFPLPLTDSLISQDGAGIHIGGLSITPAGVIGSGGAASGQVLTADGFGGTNWLSPAPVINVWSLSGNAGTGCDATPCSNFLGTTDNSSLELQVNGQRAYRIEPATVSSPPDDHADGFSPNIVGGFSGNFVVTGVGGATISGGGAASMNTADNINRVTDDFGVVGGGRGNQAGDNAGTVGDGVAATVGGGANNIASNQLATVAGGFLNSASGAGSFVAGGVSNTASGSTSTVGGGNGNVASGDYATVGGGLFNTASGQYARAAGGLANTASGEFSAVAGGESNTASGSHSFAAGQHANTNGKKGAFVWGDFSVPTDVNATADNEFVARASGGVVFFTSPDISTGATLPSGGGSWASVSDRDVKEHFSPVDNQQLLAHLLALPITTWNYKTQNATIHHIGPIAQDFYAAFKVGEDDKHITAVDEGGVALAAIQGLDQKLLQEAERLDSQVSQLNSQLQGKDLQLAAQQRQIDRLQGQVTELLRSVLTADREHGNLTKKRDEQ